jgi:hypothetical protein
MVQNKKHILKYYSVQVPEFEVCGIMQHAYYLTRVLKAVTLLAAKYLVFRHVRKIAKSDYQLRHVCPFVRPTAWNNSASTGRIFMKFDI